MRQIRIISECFGIKFKNINFIKILLNCFSNRCVMQMGDVDSCESMSDDT